MDTHKKTKIVMKAGTGTILAFVVPFIVFPFCLMIGNNDYTVGLLLILGILLSIFGLNGEITLSNMGITEKTFFKHIFISWNTISCVDHGILKGHNTFCFQKNGRRDSITLISADTNFKEALKFAVKKISPDIFSDKAQKKLKKMGIWEK